MEGSDRKPPGHAPGFLLCELVIVLLQRAEGVSSVTMVGLGFFAAQARDYVTKTL